MATKQRKKWKWDECQLCDSDGGSPSSHAGKMDEYRRYNGISGYWFYDSTDCETEFGGDHERVWDEYHDEFRWPEDVGPSTDEIDWAGLDEVLAAEHEENEREDD